MLIVLTLARVVNWCFRAHYPLFYHAVFGIVLASTVVIIPLRYDGARDALLCLLAAALGALAAYLSAKLQPKEDAIFAASSGSSPVTSQKATATAWAQLLPVTNNSAAFSL